jgi:hypothetical protein
MTGVPRNRGSRVTCYLDLYIHCNPPAGRFKGRGTALTCCISGPLSISHFTATLSSPHHGIKITRILHIDIPDTIYQIPLSESHSSPSSPAKVSSSLNSPSSITEPTFTMASPVVYNPGDPRHQGENRADNTTAQTGSYTKHTTNSHCNSVAKECHTRYPIPTTLTAQTGS